MNRPKVCRPGNRRWIHDAVAGSSVPCCQPTSTSKWHRLPNNLTTNCQTCIRLRRADQDCYIQTSGRRRYFDSVDEAHRVAADIFEKTGVVVGVQNGRR